jgi:nucleotide-binding universal stress UspA family protein
MFRTLMVPLDGSACGEYALPLALTIARRAGATVNLAHVCVPPVWPDLGHTPQPDDDDISPSARGRLYLEQLAELLSPCWEVPITTSLLEGPVAAALREHALTVGADLVALTTHGRGSLARIALGSVADELLRTLPLPLLITRPREEGLDLLESVHEHACQRVLVPLDGSAPAEAALHDALALGGLFDAEYTLLQAIDLPLVSHALASTGTSLDQHALADVRQAALEYLNQIAAHLRAGGRNVCVDTAIGYPATAILEYARDHAFELITMGSHGRGRGARLLLDSTTDVVVHGASVPVLVCRDQAAPGGEG